MARMAKNNDALVDAINRMAQAQEKSNYLLEKSVALHGKSFELNSKQYTLNIDNHTFNLKQIEVEKEYSEAVQKAMEDAKQYMDEQYNKLWNMTQQQVSLLLSSHHELEQKVSVSVKANPDQVAKSIFEKIKFKPKGTI